MDFDISTPTGARTVNICLPPFRYGVLVSGGFDSSLLLALILMARAEKKIKTPFTAYNVRRGCGTEKFSEEMVQMMEWYFSTSIQFEHLDMLPETPHEVQVRNSTVPLLNAGRIMTAICADTTNPPIDTPGWLAPMRVSVEDQFKYKRWSLPLLHLDKSHTVGLVRKLGLHFIETHSHTCTQLDQYRCGKCFQCQERAWAYRTLGLTDLGQH